MTELEFWAIIKLAREQNSNEPAKALEPILDGLSSDEILSYAEHFNRFFCEAYRWDLWSAGYLMDGGCSDDGFMDFRYGLIARGENVYRKALENPESLAELGRDAFLRDEDFGYVHSRAFESKTGSDLPRFAIRQPDEPAGEEWDFDDEDEAKRRFPKLFAVFGNEE